MKKAIYVAFGLLVSALIVSFVLTVDVNAQVESGSVGIEGRISAPPPTIGASISTPSNGSSFTTNPITVAGICPNGLLVKVFKNDVFGGSVTCENGSFSILVDLFSGVNILVARVYDDLDQPGPDSNSVSVNFDDGTATNGANRITLTSNFAKRGANPNDDLTWPLVISGGDTPYAISVDWGDGQSTLYSVAIPGEFIIKHVYKNSGIYKIIVKAVDADGVTAYIQLVAIANGNAVQQSTAPDNQQTQYIFLWQPTVVLILFVILTFWLGKRYELRRIKNAIDEGRRPF